MPNCLPHTVMVSHLVENHKDLAERPSIPFYSNSQFECRFYLCYYLLLCNLIQLNKTLTTASLRTVFNSSIPKSAVLQESIARLGRSAGLLWFSTNIVPLITECSEDSQGIFGLRVKHARLSTTHGRGFAPNVKQESR